MSDADDELDILFEFPLWTVTGFGSQTDDLLKRIIKAETSLGSVLPIFTIKVNADDFSEDFPKQFSDQPTPYKIADPAFAIDLLGRLEESGVSYVSFDQPVKPTGANTKILPIRTFIDILRARYQA